MRKKDGKATYWKRWQWKKAIRSKHKIGEKNDLLWSVALIPHINRIAPVSLFFAWFFWLTKGKENCQSSHICTYIFSSRTCFLLNFYMILSNMNKIIVTAKARAKPQFPCQTGDGGGGGGGVKKRQKLLPFPVSCPRKELTARWYYWLFSSQNSLARAEIDHKKFRL